MSTPSLFQVSLSWIDDEAEVHPVADLGHAKQMLREFAGVDLIVESTPDPGCFLAELHPDWQEMLRENGWFGLSTDVLEDAVECEWPDGAEWPTAQDLRPLSMRPEQRQ